MDLSTFNLSKISTFKNLNQKKMNSSTTQAAAEKKKSGRWADLPDYEVDWLDYEFVNKCDESSKLRDIYTILQSGKEGRYPHLEDHVEKRLLEVLPARERKLWVAQRTEPSYEDKSTAAFDLDAWADDVSKTDKLLATRAKIDNDSNSAGAQSSTSAPVDDNDIFGDAVAPPALAATAKTSKRRGNLPPVRNQVKPDGSSSSSSNGSNDVDDGADSDDDSNEVIIIDPNSEEAIRARNDKRRRYGFEYFEEWDKFDPDAEMKKMEEMEEKEAAVVLKNIQKHEEIMKEREARRIKELRELGIKNDKEDMTVETRKFVAENEKRKGNECFRAKEFDEAYLYYSRSIYFDNSQHITFANRAMVCIRLKKYRQAEMDCTASLDINATYTKAISRRGMARHKQGKYLEAIEDFEAALKSKPTSKELKDLLSKSKKMHSEVGGIRSDGSAVPVPERKKNQYKRIQIIEADSSDDDEDDEDDNDDNDDSDQNFSACGTFGGQRDGFVYQMGDQGLGYYPDKTIKKAKKKMMTRITIEEDSSDEEDATEAVSDDTPASITTSIPSSDASNIMTSGYPHEQKEDLEEKTDAMAGSKIGEGKESVQISDITGGTLDPSALKAAATAAFKRGDLPQALLLFKQASDAFEKYDTKNIVERIKCLNNSALCGQQLGKNAMVVDVCSQVLSLDNQNVKALLRRGIAYEELSNFNLALDDMCTIMTIDPSQSSVAESMERLLKYISGEGAPPTKKTPTTTASPVQSNTGKKSATPAAPAAPAAPILPPAPVVPEETSEELKQKGNTAFKAKQYKEAAVLYTRAFNVDPTNAAVLGNRAMAHLKLNQHEHVVKDCTEGLTILKKMNNKDDDKNKNKSLSVKLLYRRATALHKMGGESLTSALVDFQTIVDMEPTNTKATEGVESVTASIGLYQAVKANTPVTKQSPTKKSISEDTKMSATPEQQNVDRAAPTTKMSNTPIVNAAVEQARARAQVPSTPPKTSFEIEKVLRDLKHDMNAWGEYLSKIPTKKLSKLMGSSLSEDMLASMIQGIAAYFIPTHAKRALNFMKQLAKVNRFGTNLMFLSDSDKQILTSIFVALSSCNVNQETVKKVRKSYGI